MKRKYTQQQEKNRTAKITEQKRSIEKKPVRCGWDTKPSNKWYTMDELGDGIARNQASWLSGFVQLVSGKRT